MTNPLAELEPLLTVIDVSKVIGLPETTVVEQLIRPGRLRAERIGKSYFVHPDSVREFYATFGSESHLGTVVPDSRESA